MAPLVFPDGYGMRMPPHSTMFFQMHYHKTPGPGTGAVREVTGLGVWFREEITAYDPPRSYSYRILRSIPPIDHEGGTLTFTPAGDGTHVDWVTTYTHPTRAGGKAMEAVTRRVLSRSFLDILAGCAKALEQRPTQVP